MLDLNIIRFASMQKIPYSWVKLQNIIPIKERIELAKYYPEEQLFHKVGAEWTPMTGPCLNEKIGI
ncbi:hypothetical protein I8752_33365 [Nostocaceae cyanobacterium CENA369]|uniref:Uncharacterized protein n=1 Tax=Dendronalium phyllosphericum CENA369 TaxID=1725256 RepID=A0A8J7I7Y3_9NOST|nr:hypothetical protein [Dendronalium phyllosphericum]MBH8577771.1 hypothetical protein [Dendronalium phyllosphericum CENA369]